MSEIRRSRRKLDKLAPIRNIIELFVSNCKKSCKLGEYITIDGKLEPFRGRDVPLGNTSQINLQNMG